MLALSKKFQRINLLIKNRNQKMSLKKQKRSNDLQSILKYQFSRDKLGWNDLIEIVLKEKAH